MIQSFVPDRDRTMPCHWTRTVEIVPIRSPDVQRRPTSNGVEVARHQREASEKTIPRASETSRPVKWRVDATEKGLSCARQTKLPSEALHSAPLHRAGRTRNMHSALDQGSVGVDGAPAWTRPLRIKGLFAMPTPSMYRPFNLHRHPSSRLAWPVARLL